MQIRSIKDYFLLIIIILFVFYVGMNFSVSDGFTGIYDDSGLYMVAAAVYADPEGVSEPFSFLYDNYRRMPPGFPFVLAATGAYGSAYYAHLLVLIEFVIFLFFLFLFYRRELGSGGMSLLLLLAFLSLPAVWIELLKIMSENQFMLLVYATLYYFSGKRLQSLPYMQHVMAGLLIAFCVLTRTIGVALLLSYLFVYYINRTEGKQYLGALFFLIASIVPILAWAYLFSGDAKGYASSFDWLVDSDDKLGAIYSVVGGNMVAISWSIAKVFYIYMNDGDWVKKLLLISVVFFSLVGFVSSRRQLHAIFVLIYMLIISVWVFPLEMDRFLYPIIPLIMLYGVLGVKSITGLVVSDVSHKASFGAQAVMVLLIISISLPSTVFIYKRYQLGKEFYGHDVSFMPILYYEKDVMQAFSGALLSKRYQDAFSKLSEYIGEGEVVLSLKPEVVTFLGGVYAERLPSITSMEGKDEFIDQLLSSGASYLLISEIIFQSDPLGFDLLSLVDEYASPVYEQRSDITGVTTLALLKIHRKNIE